ncbi:hypothetical protein Pla108_04820 [Botrimarina colliarenosi]|uniref:Dockerin domain-containing protein n=1 Tax=Botrimarina colliarenosi TaxID=2528001 RepID=A0A5C6AIU3_9BACT|nr:dockerin type I domain-containing protein [Botrimarina colliarenosi]TWT99539.1 hypothetical protein Pla108_04820 [Botrimarina colliarenosi]
MFDQPRLGWLLPLLMGASAVAGGPIPAVDLPAVVPDSVRDTTARALADSRDRLSWATHPFRGEFHGLGAIAGGSSQAYDLSANGRVVVGANVDSTGGSRGFVWSPWTGRTAYNMLPNGVTGDTVATTISADGVYVAGNITTPGSTFADNPAFRWSLAGRELIPAPANGSRTAAAISGDGRVVVGTTEMTIQIVAVSNQSDVTTNVSADDVGPTPLTPLTILPFYPVGGFNQAYQYTRASGVEELDLPLGNSWSESVDVSSSGDVVLGNTSSNAVFVSPNLILQKQPVLWRNGEPVGLGIRPWPSLPAPGNTATDDVHLSPYFPNPPIFQPLRTTTANALSADGRTVVGVETTSPFVLYAATDSYSRDVYYPPSFYSESKTAILWREETGWIDLGELKTTSFRSFIGAEAMGVSGDGSTVIGEATVTCGFNEFCPFSTIETPFIWDEARGMRELADVLRLDYGLDLSGWQLDEATGISDDGTTIIGNGRNSNGQIEAWRAVLDRNTPEGDIDFDGDVDQVDYQRLVGNLGVTADDGAVFYADGDLNADGRIDQADADALLGVYQYRWKGDFNADGRVDIADYTMWRDHLGQFTGGLADANGDGWVNHADLALWQAHYGEIIASLIPHSVPEPTTLVATLATLLLATTKRRR